MDMQRFWTDAPPPPSNTSTSASSSDEDRLNAVLGELGRVRLWSTPARQRRNLALQTRLSRNRVRYFVVMKQVLESGRRVWYEKGNLALLATHTLTLEYARGTFQLRVCRNSVDSVVLILSHGDDVEHIDGVLRTQIVEDVPCSKTEEVCVSALMSALERAYFS